MKMKSEQLLSDGSFQMYRYLEQANNRLNKLGKHGKRCKLKRTGDNVVLQFNYNGQTQRSPNCSFTKQGINEAEKIAAMITNQLVANQYSDEWLNRLLGKSKSIKTRNELTCIEMMNRYKANWQEENKSLKRKNDSWYNSYRHIEKIFLETKKTISLDVIEMVICQTNKDTLTRTYTLNGLIKILSYFSINEFDHIIQKYKSKNKPKPQKKYIPNDNEIMTIYNLGFEIITPSAKHHFETYSRWRFLYALLATYGLRIHEAWNIANWENSVILKDNDWIEVGLENDSVKENTFIERFKGNQEVIPAILDPNNKSHILAIKHDTKTGYRMAMPLSPIGHNWLQEFNLITEFNLPIIKNPLQGTGKDKRSSNCSSSCGKWFRRHKYGFTPHALRHAYNHRAHQQGLKPKLIADTLGHSIQMNQSTYLESMNNSRQIQMMKQAINEIKNEQSNMEKIKAENKYLKAENERLKTELKMYQILKKYR